MGGCCEGGCVRGCGWWGKGKGVGGRGEGEGRGEGWWKVVGEAEEGKEVATAVPLDMAVAVKGAEKVGD